MKDTMKATVMTYHNGPIKINVSLTTEELIAELGKRNPCVKCSIKKYIGTACDGCYWQFIGFKNGSKEANHGKV